MIAALSLLLIGSMQEPAFPTAPVKMSGLVDVAGKKLSIPAAGAKVTVVVFVMTDCPIANKMAPELVRICESYRSRGVSFVLDYVDPSVGLAAVRKHLKEFGYSCPGFLDKKHTLVKALGATVTPQAAVLDASGRLVYRGRINDLYEDHGKARATPTRNDLRDALDQILAGKKVARPIVTATGCYIPPLG